MYTFKELPYIKDGVYYYGNKNIKLGMICSVFFRKNNEVKFLENSGRLTAWGFIVLVQFVNLILLVVGIINYKYTIELLLSLLIQILNSLKHLYYLAIKSDMSTTISINWNMLAGGYLVILFELFVFNIFVYAFRHLNKYDLYIVEVKGEPKLLHSGNREKIEYGASIIRDYIDEVYK